ncbi:MAG: NVEALA domain-containing protein [Bacteroidales bacterium]|jgi:predicted ester cyclase|nr:NVEALA domain-containing protein [Bacteroidales bacterium]
MKKILFCSFAAGVIALSAYHICLNNQKATTLGDVVLDNVEALADPESPGVYMEGKDDRWDTVRHCYYQCVENGTGCFYYYNYPYNC